MASSQRPVRSRSADCSREVAAAVLAADWEPSTRACDVLLDGLALLTREGYVAGVPALKVALRAFRDEPLSEEDELRWLWLACRIARALADDGAWDELTACHLDVARRVGAFSALPVALTDRVLVELFSGRTGVAMSLAAESDAVVEATGSHLTLRTSIVLENWRGRDAWCRRAARAWLRVTLTAMPSSHGRSDPPSGLTVSRSRQASRNVSETTSSAADQLPLRPRAYRYTACACSSNSAANASGSPARTRSRTLASTLRYCPDATVTFSSPSALSPGHQTRPTHMRRSAPSCRGR